MIEERTIKIGDDEFKMKASVLTLHNYKLLYGVELFNQLQSIGERGQEGIKAGDEELLQIAYLMIAEANENFMDYNDWIKGLNHIYKDKGWIKEVVELAMSIFQ